MITGLAALAQKPLNPDKGNGPKRATGDDKGGKGKDKGNGGGRNVLPAFMPGQEQALAQQLNMGFGGGKGQWSNYLDKVYSPLVIQPFTPSVPGGGRPQGNGNPTGTVVDGVEFQIGPDGRRIPIQSQQRMMMPPEYVTGLAALRGNR